MVRCGSVDVDLRWCRHGTSSDQGRPWPITFLMAHRWLATQTARAEQGPTALFTVAAR
jgi:hypothetical protein